MFFVSLLFFTTVIINLYSGICVFRANPASKTNRLCLIMSIATAIWGIGCTFMISAENATIANYWRVFSASGRYFLYGSMLLFSVSFTDNRGILSKAFVQWLVFVVALLFFINTTKYPDSMFIRTTWGWMYRYSDRDMLWFASFVAYYTLSILCSAWLIYCWGKNSGKTREKKQAKIIVKVMLLVYILGTLVDAIMPMLGFEVVQMGIVFTTIFLAGIWYSITRYKLMMLNFKTASDHILTNMMDPVLLVGENLMIQEVNLTTLVLTGYEKKELIGKPLSSIIDGDTGRFINSVELFAEKDTPNLEVAISAKNQCVISCLLSIKVLYDEFQDVLGFIFLLHDITDRKRYEQLLKQTNGELEDKVRERTLELNLSNKSLQKEIVERKAAEDKVLYNANHDLLTGLPNRRLYNERLTNALSKAQLNGDVFAVVYIDIDNFKYLNDTFGHTHGDLVLEEVANRMSKFIRRGDMLARIGGDEFLLLVENLEQVTMRDTIETILFSLQTAFEKIFLIGDRECILSVSSGVALYPEDGTELDDLIKHADIAMYEAKYSGKNTYQFCSSSMKRKVLEQAHIRNNLFRALDNDELLLFYQPQVDVATGEIHGFEALLRWKMKHELFVPPNEFIAIAEETGLIVPIGIWVMKTAFLQLKQWHELGFKNLRMAINVSARQLMENDFIDKIVAHLEHIGLAPEYVEIEITESVAVVRDEGIIAMIDKIKEQNISLAIDDFGTDYSSFMNVKLMPVDRLKIAMPFISGIGKNHKDTAIVSSIIALSHKLGVKVIAEGVESLEEVEYLRREKCDDIQGYYYYKPLPPEKILAILNKNRERC
ncbi:MAG: sensory box/GGDEF family protein [Firmicutes bacterium]|nr:sensory box/GGDEF family protein [Bacillota bacterium]